MALNDTLVRAAKPRERDWKLADEKGLYLLVTASGSKLWRVKFRLNGKEKKLSLGAYPEISLKDARRLRDEARGDLAAGIDPARQKQEEKIVAKLGAANSFEAVAEEYLAKCEKEGLADVTVSKNRWFLGLLRPSIGKLPIADIKPHEVLRALQKVENKGNRETANRMRSFASRVFRYAVATARAEADPAHALRGALKEKDVALSTLVDKLNDRFGTDFTQADQLFFDQVSASAVHSDKIVEAAKANSLANFASYFERVLDDLFIQRMEGNDEIFARVMSDKQFRTAAHEHLAREVFERVRNGEGGTGP